MNPPSSTRRARCATHGFVLAGALVASSILTAAAFDTLSFSPKVNFPTESGQVSVAFGDLDGDGKPEAVTANYSSGNLSIFRNTSETGAVTTATFASRVNFATASTPVLVRLADLNGDGRLDIVCVNQGSSSLSLLLNTATNGTIDASSFASKIDLTTPGDPRWAAVADLNADGKLDLVTASYSSGKLALFENNSSGSALSFAPRVDLTPAAAPTTVEAADVDGDGKPELLAAHAALPTVGVYQNTLNAGGALGATSFAAAVSFATGNGSTVSVGDLDGDGKVDLFTPNASDNTLSVLRNTSTVGEISSSTFAPKVVFPAGNYPYSAAHGDLDGDGKPEVVIGNSSGHNVSVFRNNSSNGVFNATSLLPRVDYPAGSGPRIAALVDVDGDGLLDIATPNLSQAAFSVLRRTNVTPPPTEPGEGFDLSRDFSMASNPNSAWSYGWKGSASGPFGLLLETGTATFDNGAPAFAWVLAGVGQPAVYYNPSSETGIGAGGQFVIPGGTVWFYPGFSGRAENFGAVRFTAPSNSNYHVQAAVAAIYDGNLSDDNEFRVAVNNVEAFGGFLPPNVGTNFSAVVALNAGESVDFLVGRGANGNEYGSALKLTATIAPTTNAAIVITNTPPPPPPTGEGDFNLARDFSPNVNPNGVWGYGWKQSLSGSFTADPFHFTAVSDNGKVVSGWAANQAYGLPAHYCNTSGSTAIIGGGQGVLPPGTFWMHPGRAGRPENFGAVRFTAPSNANYLVETTADALYSGSLSGDTDYHVVVNDVEVFAQPLPATAGTAWTNIVALAAGDTIDFALGRGADGNDWGAGLKIRAIITATTNDAITITNPPPPPPPPPPAAYADFNAGRDFAASVNPAGAWSYGWKGTLEGSFTLDPIFFGATSDNGVSVSGWAANSTFGLPALYCNTTANTAIIGGGQGVLPPGTLWIHPGANGQPENFGALRFTAPSNANYLIETTADSLYSGSLSGDTDYHVVVNGVEIFGQALAATAGTSFTNVVALQAGETVDFAIGRGADGDGWGAGLKVIAILTATTNAPVVITNPPPAPPVLVSQPPLFQSVAQGGTVSFSVTASGHQPMSYQWLFDGAEIEGATSSMLIVSNAQPENAGTYRVIVSNVAGAVTNAGTALNVTVSLGGTVTFINSSSNRVYDVGASTFVPNGGTMVAGLFVSTNENAFEQVGGTATFILPGRFSGGMRFIPGTTAGQTVALQVRVWDTAFGSTYDSATAGKRGSSAVFNLTLGGGIQPPPALFSMPAFALTLPGLAAAQVKSTAPQPVSLQNLARTDSGWAFAISGTPGATYEIEASTDLVEWKTVAYVVVGELGSVNFDHNDPVVAKRFYRARLANP